MTLNVYADAVPDDGRGRRHLHQGGVGSVTERQKTLDEQFALLPSNVKSALIGLLDEVLPTLLAAGLALSTRLGACWAPSSNLSSCRQWLDPS